MTPTPFTGDVLRSLYQHASMGTPAELVAAELRWDMPTLQRRCRDRCVPLEFPPPGAVRKASDQPPLSAARVNDSRHIKINARPEIDSRVFEQFEKYGLHRTSGLIRVISAMERDEELLAAALAPARAEPAGPIGTRVGRYEVRITPRLKSFVADTARTEGRCQSWVIFAFFDCIISNDLWDVVLSGEAS